MIVYSQQELEDILNQLTIKPAREFENEHLDFKQWPDQLKEGVNLAVKMTVCFANATGGILVLGVKDDVVGRDDAIIGVPDGVDINELKRRIFEQTSNNHEVDIKAINYTNKRVVLINIPEATQKYISDQNGRYTKRVGSNCMPIKGPQNLRWLSEDISAAKIDDLAFEDAISPSALESVRKIIKEGDAPKELLRLLDNDLCSRLRIIIDGNITLGGLFIAGKSEAIRDRIPVCSWAYRRMISDTEYSLREEGADNLLFALSRLMDLIKAANPIMTVQDGIFHYEFRTFSEIALREALLNAFGHRDFSISGSVMVKHYKDRIEISNPGRFPSGITKDNILHYGSSPRNPHLFEILTRLRLVNISNLGVPRIFRELLSEGKEPPEYEDTGQRIRLTFFGQKLNESFRKYIIELQAGGIDLSVDDLIILHYLQRHPEIDMIIARGICHQRPDTYIREILSSMENRHLLQRRGSGKGTSYLLSIEAYNKLKGDLAYERERKLEDEHLKARILQTLHERDLTNSQIRTITGLDRYQAIYLMRSLQKEGLVELQKRGRASIWKIR